jgi:hypothetical protein
MNLDLRPLFTLAVTHAYYGGPCRDLGFVLPSDAEQLLRGGRLLARTVAGRLHVLFEAGEDGGPRVSLAGRRLRLGLRLLNPHFANFSAPAGAPAGLPLWRNAAAPAALDPPRGVRLSGPLLVHGLEETARPVTVTVEDEDGRPAAAPQTVDADDGRGTVSFSLPGAAPGLLRVTEQAPASAPRTAEAYLHPELAQGGVLGIVEVRIAAGFYAAPAAFEIAFAARQETLKYYLVAKGYGGAELEQLAVIDAGFTDEARPQVAFDRVPGAELTADDLPPALLGNPAEVVLFRSAAPVARRERGRRKIQLKRNGDVLIEHLPQPGAERAAADLIVHLSKS